MVVGKIQLPTGILKADLVIMIFSFIYYHRKRLCLQHDFLPSIIVPGYDCCAIFKQISNCYHIFRVVKICRKECRGSNLHNIICHEVKCCIYTSCMQQSYKAKIVPSKSASIVSNVCPKVSELHQAGLGIFNTL